MSPELATTSSPLPPPRSDVIASTCLTDRARVLALTVLFAAALGVRLYHADEPLNFHGVRQYHSLLIARAYYVETLAAVPEWKKEVPRVSRERQGMWEPHLMESLVAAAYRVVGGEHLWIPHLVSSLAGLIGGGFLYLTGSRIADADAALFSTGFYLFLPFAIVASRSFQPDPLMVAALIVSTFAILRYYESPSGGRLVVAASLSAFAIVVKFIALFAVMGALVSAGVYTRGFRKLATSRHGLLFAVVSLLPGFIFYSYQIFVSQALLGVAQGDVLPQLLIHPFFWKGWLVQIGAVVGYSAWIGALLGTLMVRERLASGLLTGLWVGYLVFGLVFSYTVHTHDYWNLRIIPIVALSLGPVVALVTRRVLADGEDWRRQAAIGAIGALALALSIGMAQARIQNPVRPVP